MPATPMLTVIAVPGALVQDDRAALANARRYVGRELSPRPDATDLESAYPPVAQKYPDDGDHLYLKKALKRGDLLPCDAYTARRAGVAYRGAVSPQKGE